MMVALFPTSRPHESFAIKGTKSCFACWPKVRERSAYGPVGILLEMSAGFWCPSANGGHACLRGWKCCSTSPPLPASLGWPRFIARQPSAAMRSAMAQRSRRRADPFRDPPAASAWRGNSGCGFPPASCREWPVDSAPGPQWKERNHRSRSLRSHGVPKTDRSSP